MIIVAEQTKEKGTLGAKWWWQANWDTGAREILVLLDLTVQMVDGSEQLEYK
jgi:hypothetical protein